MGMYAALALMIGVAMSIEGQTSLALSSLCGASFFIFAYHNPEALIAQRDESEVQAVDVVQTKFLWTALAVGLIAALL